MTAQELWEKYAEEYEMGDTAYEAWQFGVEPDTLADLVLRGEKTATSSLACLYRLCDDPLPQADAYSVILNEALEAVCIIKTVKITILPYLEVTEQMAALEGEGDKSLAYWRAAHEAFFKEECFGFGMAFDEDMEVVFEEFAVVYKAEQ